MADQKISELTNITGANLANADEFVVVDVSADQTKAVTRAEFFKDTPDITVTGTVISDGDMTTKGTFAVNRTSAGYGAVEVGGASGALIDLKAPSSDDYDARIIYNTGADLQIITLASGEPIRLKVGNTTRLTANSTGAAVTGNLTATGTVTAGDVNITGPSPILKLIDDDVVNEYTQIQNVSGVTYIDNRNGATNGFLIFRGLGGGVIDEYARFTPAGNFAIGETNPDTLLHVTSGTTAGVHDVATFGGGSSGGASSTGDEARIILTTNPTNGNLRGAWISAENTSGGGQAHDMLFYTNASSSVPVEAMRIDSSGRLLVGASAAPDFDGTLAYFYNSGNNAAVFRANTANWCTVIQSGNGTNTGQAINFRHGAAQVGTIETSATGLSINLGGTAAANKLEDYEEGTWANSLTGSTTNPTYSQASKYTKVGSLVTLHTEVIFITAGSGNYYFPAAALPFVRDGNYITGTVSVLNDGVAWYTGVARADSTNIAFHVGAHQGFSSAVPFAVGAGDRLHVTITYRTTA